ncbi:ATP-binding cassette domain-containing protein [Puniceicoccaceae bacterium K14]|nr:ATP-binding cassette domain-containing protein [Puniceicoccaceae bacterium K14]
MRLFEISHKGLVISNWTASPYESWCLLNGNTAHNGTVAAFVAKEAVPDEGELSGLPLKSSIVSLKKQQALYEKELENDDSDFTDRINYGSTGEELLARTKARQSRINEIVLLLSIENLLSQHFRLYSSGESRKIMLAIAFLEAPDLLILNDPFEGLDVESRSSLQSACVKLARSGQRLLTLVSKPSDIPQWSTHLGVFTHGALIKQGPMPELMSDQSVRQLLHINKQKCERLPAPPIGPDLEFEELVILKNGFVRYGDAYQFKNFNWTLRKGEHTSICGPNGAGKSTLLQLITGDHPQCYSNHLTVFGKKRGSGESIWEIKKHVGIVSASLHRDYRAPGNALSTVLSGLYDSIGLYQQPTRADTLLARSWIELIGLQDLTSNYFQQFSYGQQRLLLIARGLIKQPPLLILDEPTQGLDELNRQIVLSFIERLAELSQTTLLFVSHREDEHLPLFQHRIEFHHSTEDNVRFEAQAKKLKNP